MSPTPAHSIRLSGRPLQHAIVSAFAAAALGTFAVPAATQSSHAHSHASAPSAAQLTQRAVLDRQATDLSQGLLRSMNALDGATATNRAQRASEVVSIARERRKALLALVKEDPARVLALAMPAELRGRLPQEAQKLVEQRVQTDGVVVAMVVEDMERGVASHPYFLDAEGPWGKAQFDLHWADAAMSERDQEALIAKRVRVKALQLGRNLIVGKRDDVESAYAGSTTTSSGSSTDLYSSTSPAVSGDQNTLVILANFTDKTVGCSVDTVRNVVFGTTGSVDQIFRQSSRGAVTFSGNVVGPFTIPYSSTSTCDYRTWGSAADSAAKAAGIDVTKYTRISYAIPSNGNCGWSGVANVGGTPPTRSWVAQCSSPGLFAHELGHNLLFKHASTPTSEYGDGSDPMGNIPRVQHNGANKTMAGWLAPGNVADAAASGTYSIAALAAPDSGSAQVVRLRKADTSEYYYVSLRQPIDLDSGLSSTYQSRVAIHTSTGTMPIKTVLRTTLGAGGTFTDSVNGITIAAQSISSTSATLSVQLTGATCATSAPTFSVGPSSQSAPPGGQASYSVTVKNNDSSACSSGTFSLAQVLPTGFSGSFSAPSVTLAPGSSASVGWSVASSSTAASAVYDLKASASSTSGSATGAATLQVYTDTTPPTVSVTSPADGSSIPAKRTTLAASAYDNTAVARVEFYVNGTLIGSSSAAPYQVGWNPGRKGTGEYLLTARAFDKAGNQAEAASRFIVK